MLDDVDVTQTNMAFFRHHLTTIATHILHCTGEQRHRLETKRWRECEDTADGGSNATSLFLDETFGPTLLRMCNRALFECLALNLHCLRGDQRALTAVINHRIVSFLLLV